MASLETMPPEVLDHILQQMCSRDRMESILSLRKVSRALYSNLWRTTGFKRGQKQLGFNDWFECLKRNMIQSTRALIAAGVNVNMRDHHSNTALHRLIKYGNVRLLSLCLSAPRVRVNARNKHGHTPLMLAVQQGDYHSVSLLLQSPGIDINSVCAHGRTALMYSLMVWAPENRQIFFLLMDNPDIDLGQEDRLGRGVLHFAARRANKTIIDVLMARFNRLDIDKPSFYMNWTPLHWAVRANNFKAVDALLRMGAKITYDHANMTPYGHAVALGHPFVTSIFHRYSVFE